MQVINIHEREISATPVQVGALVDALTSAGKARNQETPETGVSLATAIPSKQGDEA